jgi:hypothetical protein
MANLMVSCTATPPSKLLDGENLVGALLPWRKQLLRRQVFCWLLRGIIIGLVLACFLLLVARVFPWGTAPSWAIGCSIACPVLSLSLAIWYRPSFARVASIIDKQLGLHDRMSTAWELREQSSVLVGLQRRDALQQLAKYKPATTFPLHFQRSTVVTLICTALVFALLVFLPNPMNRMLKQQAELQTRLARQITAIEKTRHQIDTQSAVPAKEKQQIDQILHDLEEQLQNAKSETEAQQDLADAQAKLDQLRNSQAVMRIQSQSAAGQSLQSSSDANLQALGKVLTSNETKSLAQALQKLASQAGHLSQAQRDQLAQQLQVAASQASQNSDVQSALRQLAQALADKNTKEIAKASQALQATANQTAVDNHSQSSLNQASQGLQNAANNLAAPTDNPNGSSQDQRGQGQNQGQRSQEQKKGQDQGQDRGQGQDRQGQGQGQSGQGQGQDSSGKTKRNHGKDEQVYVAGQINQGSGTQSTDDSSSSVQSGNQVPYSQVIAQYNQMAHDAIDNSSVSPDDKDLVHDYFNSLEGRS